MRYLSAQSFSKTSDVTIRSAAFGPFWTGHSLLSPEMLHSDPSDLEVAAEDSCTLVTGASAWTHVNTILCRLGLLPRNPLNRNLSKAGYTREIFHDESANPNMRSASKRASEICRYPLALVGMTRYLDNLRPLRTHPAACFFLYIIPCQSSPQNKKIQPGRWEGKEVRGFGAEPVELTFSCSTQEESERFLLAARAIPSHDSVLPP